MSNKRIYAAIDLKSFYASVECVERGLDPLRTHLVVADESKSEKTICLAVSPSLKSYGISGRARLFEVNQKVHMQNTLRKKAISYKEFRGESYDVRQLQENPYQKISFLIAPPRMAFYLKYSARIYEVYLKYVSCEDIHVYSIDEVFIDITSYLKHRQQTPREFVKDIILDIYQTTNITATAGIGTNLYLCKVAMDIVAKQCEADRDGVRIAFLDEKSYRQNLWHHQPLTDFWRVGEGYQKKLYEVGLYTMGDIAKCSIGEQNDYYNEHLLYRMFGVNAQLLIDHAWGYESCTMQDIKAYQPMHHSLGRGQVLHSPYSFDKARLVVKEMVEALCLELVEKKLVTNQIVISVGYDQENIIRFQGEIKVDRYGRKIPKKAHGTICLPSMSSSYSLIKEVVINWYDEHVDTSLTIRRLNIVANNIEKETNQKFEETYQQLNLFDNDSISFKQNHTDMQKERRLQEATLLIKKKFGKNSVLKGMNLEEGSTAKQRNNTIGGHKA